MGKVFAYEILRQQWNRYQDPICCGNYFLFYPHLSSHPHMPNLDCLWLLHIRPSFILQVTGREQMEHSSLGFPPSVPCIPMVTDLGIIRPSLQELSLLFSLFFSFQMNPKNAWLDCIKGNTNYSYINEVVAVYIW